MARPGRPRDDSSRVGLARYRAWSAVEEGRRFQESCSGRSIQVPSTSSPLASRRESTLVSATNGKTTTTAMAAEILGAGRRLAWNRAGANLLSGVASALAAARHADLGLFEVDEGALPEALVRTRPRVVTLGNLFRDQLDRYGELEIVAERWRTALSRLPPDATLVVNADDPIVADLADGRRARSPIRPRRPAPSALRPAARSRLEVLRAVRCPVRLCGDLRRPPRGLPLPRVRSRTAAPRRVGCGHRAARASRLALSARNAGRRDGDRARSPRALQRLQRRWRQRRLRSQSVRRSRTCAPALHDSVLRSADSRGFPPAGKAVVLLLIKNPAGANEVRPDARDRGSARSRASRSTTRSPMAETSRGSGMSTSSRSSSMSGSSSRRESALPSSA